MDSQSVLVLSDNQLQVYAPDLLGTSSGYARITGTNVLFDVHGEPSPVSVSRLHPNQINNRYWHYCDESAVTRNDAGMRHCADLVWQHLSELKKRFQLERVCLVVPSHYQEHQLQLLLAVAEAANLSPQCVVNKAVLAATRMALKEGEQVVHVDVQLHQTVLSYLVVKDRRIQCRSQETLAGCSISALQESLLGSLQETFVGQDRFDPLHHAETEQQLFNQLSAASDTIFTKGAATFTAELNQNKYSASMDQAAFKAACLGRFEALGKLSTGTVILDVNGAFSSLLMANTLEEFSGAAVSPADIAACLPSVMALSLQSLDTTQNEVPYLRALQMRHGEQQDATDAPSVKAAVMSDTDIATDEPSATHIQLDGMAIPLAKAQVLFEQGRLQLSRGSANVHNVLATRQLVSVNGQPRTLPLTVGERLVSELADGVLIAIRVID